jgi:hypothetical protein
MRAARAAEAPRLLARAARRKRAAEAPRLLARAARRKRAVERRAEAAGAGPTASQTERQAKPRPVPAPARPGARAAEAPRLLARAARRRRAAERRAEAAGAGPTASQTERQAKPRPVPAPATPRARAAEGASRPGARAAPLGRRQPAPAAEAAPRPGARAPATPGARAAEAAPRTAAMRCSADWLRSWRTRRLGQPKQNHRRGRSGVPRHPSQVPTSRRPDLTLGRTPRHAPGADRNGSSTLHRAAEYRSPAAPNSRGQRYAVVHQPPAPLSAALVGPCTAIAGRAIAPGCCNIRGRVGL